MYVITLFIIISVIETSRMWGTRVHNVYHDFTDIFSVLVHYIMYVLVGMLRILLSPVFQ